MLDHHNTKITTVLEQEYKSVQHDTAAVHSDPGVLILSGSHVVEFLNRLSTNKLDALVQWQHITTVLTTEKAKIIDVVTVLHRDNDVLLLTSAENSTNVQKWLEKYIIMEDITVNDLSNDYASIHFVGPGIFASLERFFHANLLSHSSYSVHPVLFEDDEIILFTDSHWNIPAARLIGKKETVDSIWKSMSDTSSKEHPIQKVSTEIFEVLRIEMGIPAFGKEITDQVNPLEAGLERFVSFSKGCYIGQEVIARLDTYKKLQKRLTGFLFDKNSAQNLTPGKIFLEGIEIGWTTSHTWSLKHRRPVALGFLRTNLENNEFQFLSSTLEHEIPIHSTNLPM